jgi:hypothetical protein
MPLLIDDEAVDCVLRSFRVYHQLEAVREQGSQHQAHLIVGRSGHWFCGDVVSNGIEPIGTALNAYAGALLVVRPGYGSPQRCISDAQAARIRLDTTPQVSKSPLSRIEATSKSLTVNSSGECCDDDQRSELPHLCPLFISGINNVPPTS